MQISRVDRLLTLYLFNYLIRLGETGNQIPVLMYHSISPDKSQDDVHPYFKTNTNPDVFLKHMSYLHQNDYQVIGIEEALKIISGGEETHKKYAVITFDDGYQDILTAALPVLKEYDFTATVYLPTEFISKKGSLFKGTRCLNWQEVIELQTNNIEIGSHTITHPKLISMPLKEVAVEIKNSKSVIEDKLGRACHSFSYPFAFPEENKTFVDYLRQILIGSGYKNSVSTIVGTLKRSDENFFIKRIPVNSDDDDLFFKAKLDGAYDWLHMPQLINKVAKKIFSSTR